MSDKMQRGPLSELDIEDLYFERGWKQGVHEAVTSLLDVLEKGDLQDEWKYLVEYYEYRMRKQA